jgi:LAGLIDADG DNA endonuclease family
MHQINLDIRKSEIISLYEQGIGCGRIAFLLGGIHEDTIRNRLRKWGIVIRPQSESHNTLRKSVFTQAQIEILNGSLLSDGSLSNVGVNASFSQKTIQKQYVNHLMDVLPLDFRELYVIPGGKIQIGNRSGIAKTKYQIASRCDQTLTNFHHLWYPHKSKTIPEDIELTPLTVAHWFFGDGSTSYRNERTSVCLDFSTDSFSFHECQMLAEKFRQIDKSLHFVPWINNKRKGQPRLRTTRKSTVYSFFEYIAPHFTLKCFEYKQKLPETRK